MPKLTCSKCGRAKTANTTNFAPRSERRRGFSSACRECQRAIDKRRKKKPRAASVVEREQLALRGLRKCSRCKTAKTFAEFGPQYGTRYVDSVCKECRRIIARNAMRAKRANPETSELVAAQTQRYRQSAKGRRTKRLSAAIHNHRRRQRHLNLPFVWRVLDWLNCKLAWNHCCAYCGTRPMRLTQDHYVPLSHPSCPGTVPTNIVPACRKCNASKGDRDAAHWCSPAVIARILAYFANLPTSRAA